jgi:SAM-dependent methyltransferase
VTAVLWKGRQDKGHQDQVRALFDSKAADWPGKYAPAGPLTDRLAWLDAAVRARVRARVGTDCDVLDLGCGSGDLARRLAARGYRVTGCDIAPRMLREAAAADGGHTVRWIRVDPGWRTLPFEAASLDAVVAVSVLEYVHDPSAVLRECARVLRPGGTLLCTVPDMTHPVRWLEWPLAWAARTPMAPLAEGAWPRLRPYAAYLRVSRQRRRARWWHAAGRRSGLRPAGARGRRAPRAPLRLLTFTRPGTFPRQQGDASDNSER